MLSYRTKGSKNKKTLEREAAAKAVPEQVPDVVVPVTPRNDEPYDLYNDIFQLLQSEPFFAGISCRVDKVANSHIPTAGVRVTDAGFFELAYNPDFMRKLPEKQKLGVLKHEFYHLCFGHVTDRLPKEGMNKRWNVATDLSINGLIPDEIPEFGCFPGKGQFADLPAGNAAEWYLSKLPNDPNGNGNGKGQKGQGNGQPGQGDGSGEGEGNNPGGGKPGELDDHSGWGNGNSEKENIARERLRDILSKAAREASQRGSWGTIPENMKADILKRIQSVIDWRRVLRWFIGTALRGDKVNTIKRLNKRYPYQHPGVKVLRHARIAVAIDQSGSVGDDMLAIFFSELDKLAEIAEFTVIPFDTEVEKSLVYTWKKGQRRHWERVKCGGTDFNPPTDFVNKGKFDGLIVMTDLQAPKPKSCKVPRIWFTTPECASQPYFKTNERIVAISKSLADVK